MSAPSRDNDARRVFTYCFSCDLVDLSMIEESFVGATLRMVMHSWQSVWYYAVADFTYKSLPHVCTLSPNHTQPCTHCVLKFEIGSPAPVRRKRRNITSHISGQPGIILGFLFN